jgi:hypothetical protein
MWTDAHEARQQYNVDRLTQYVTAYQAAIDFADEQGMDVHPGNQEWLELWYSYRDKCPPLTDYMGLD